MADSNAPAQTRMVLNVARVGTGGNGGSKGEYFYSFEPSILLVTKRDTVIRVRLADEVDSQFEIDDVFWTQSKSQLSEPVIAEDRRSFTFTHANRKKMLTRFCVRVFDKLERQYIECDPEILNRPD